MSSATKKRSSSKKAAQDAAATSAEKPQRKKSKSSDTRQKAGAETDQAIIDTKTRSKISTSQVENVSSWGKQCI